MDVIEIVQYECGGGREAKENVNNDYDNGMMVAAIASTKRKNPKAKRWCRGVMIVEDW